MIQGIRHTGLVVQDLPAALHFWCDILGFRVAKTMEEFGPHIDAIFGMLDVRLTTVKLAAPDDRLIELLCFRSHPDISIWNGNPNSTGFTHIAMTVDDLSATCQKLAANGVTFTSDPQYSPDGYAKLTYARGPEGVLLELVEELRQ